ncbi:MAG: flavodoxin family protein [Veillonella sp.]|uniref:flavodoxin family protein n=1 Tax=Veillonella sp. TaxID=1926307 RepID=UPI0025F0B5A0|nr:flavodoxin family protein [Veillonella sp.]MBS4913622.1 flavodoxin family protein [Veillonella sp.]
MKSIVIYSSRTGNTKQVAEAIHSVLPEGTPIVTVKEAPENLKDYDVVFMGFWADQGNANKEAQAVLKCIDAEKVALFATLGVPPMMPHAKETMVAATQLLPEGQTPVGTFMCQGKVDPKVIEMMFKIFPDGHPHGRSAEREERHKQAASHPDANDLAKAKEFAKDVLAKLG